MPSSGVTPRTGVLHGLPGTAYVYRSYGIDALLNAVCEAEGMGAAVLIRALEPLRGLGGDALSAGCGARLVLGAGEAQPGSGDRPGARTDPSLISGPFAF